jgi:hypothetical protein
LTQSATTLPIAKTDPKMPTNPTLGHPVGKIERTGTEEPYIKKQMYMY